MSIPREIIIDLLPAYWSGEASEATRAAVEAAFADDPSFAAAALRESRALELLNPPAMPARVKEGELTTLARAKRALRMQRFLFALAWTFTLNALTLGMSIDVTDGHMRLQWLALRGQGVVVGILIVAAIALWLAYARISFRIRTRVLG